MTVRATGRFLVLALAYFVILELARHVGSWTGSYIAGAAVGFAGLVGWWLVVSVRLPHQNAPWHALIPGAMLMAVGLELISGLGSWFIATRVDSSQSAYGVLGVAAGLLFGLFLISRLVVASAVINATIWEQTRRPRYGGMTQTACGGAQSRRRRSTCNERRTAAYFGLAATLFSSQGSRRRS